MKDDMDKVVQKIIYLKEERDNVNRKRIKNFQEYKKMLGREQELSRKINSELDELSRFKVK